MPWVYEHLDTVFAWVLRSSAQASALALVILAIQFVLQKRLPARWQYALWLVLLVRIAVPWAPESPTSLFNVTRLLYAKTTPIAPSALIAPMDLTTENTETIDSEPTPPRPQSLESFSSPSSLRSLSMPPRESLPAVAWAFGALAVALYAAARNLSLWRHIRRQRPITDPRLLDLLEDCKDLMGARTPVSLVESSRLATPALVGFIRPRLVLPVNTARTLSDDELGFVVLHELAHLKRNDIFVNWVMLALQVLHWFNPIIWFAFRRMLADREAACDALALSRAGAEHAQSYGGAILRLLDRARHGAFIPGAAGILEDKSQLKRRITMIAQFTPNAYRRSFGAMLAMMLLAAIGLTNPTRAADTVAAEAPTSTAVLATPTLEPPHADVHVAPQYACEFVFFEVAPDAPLPARNFILLPEGARLSQGGPRATRPAATTTQLPKGTNLAELARTALGGNSSDSAKYRIMASPTIVLQAGKPAKMQIGQDVPVTRFEPAENGDNGVKTAMMQLPVGVDATVTVAQEGAQGPLGMDFKLEVSRVLDMSPSEHDSARDTNRAIESRAFDGHFSVTANQGQLLIFPSEHASTIVVAVLVSPVSPVEASKQPAPSTFKSATQTPRSASGNSESSQASRNREQKIADAEGRKKVIIEKLEELKASAQKVTPEAEALQKSLDRQVELAENDSERIKGMYKKGLVSDHEIEESELKLQQAREKAEANKVAQQRSNDAAQAPLRSLLDNVEVELGGLRSKLARSANTDPQQLLTPQANAALRRAQCQDNLRQLGILLKMYAAEHKGTFPALARRPGQLMFSANELFPEYMTDDIVMVCPTVKAKLHIDQADRLDATPALINDQSYFYLGYVAPTEEEGLAFIEAYRKTAASGGEFTKDLPATAPIGPAKLSSIFRLWEGIERFFVVDIANPASSGVTAATIPVMIERPGHHEPNGGHVLYMDGHVEYLSYPGKFPMTEKFIQALLDLDTHEDGSEPAGRGESTLMKGKAFTFDGILPSERSSQR